ncbi:PREDICTED: GATA transcription factor 2-like [Tarenaya hassleriana]|uniref:GATA transcription factor 2-like n=1 Tax=Tarenaya hassleriana TaxID=28532 RepID=UPI00053C5974|nr:PREDICTED: GATA transcription factor 2-like [Tarenaya hassleriana]
MRDMDVYGLSSPELIRIDDLLDFSNVNDDIFSSASSSTAAASSASSSSFHLPQNSFPSSSSSSPFLTDFTHDLCVPSDDAAQLEWLSQFVDDSFSDFPENPLGGTMINVRPDTSFTGRPRSKRSRAPAATPAGTWSPMPDPDGHAAAGRAKPKKEGGGRHKEGGGRHVAAARGVTAEGGVRRCTHCASEKTPQWRTGPLGPKTLCNACGVRFKSGRLVPEYRPAASPTFLHSHRKVMELRRQKELIRQQQQLQLHQQLQQQPPFQPQ